MSDEERSEKDLSRTTQYEMRMWGTAIRLYSGEIPINLIKDPEARPDDWMKALSESEYIESWLWEYGTVIEDEPEDWETLDSPECVDEEE